MDVSTKQTTARRDPRDQFALLPGPLQTFLLSKECFEDVYPLYKKHALSGHTLDVVVDLIGDIDFGYRPFNDLWPALTTEIKLPEALAKAFAIDLAGIHYLPIAGLLGAEVWEAIKSWGGDPQKFPVKTIEAQKITAPMLVDGLVSTIQDNLVPRMRERLRFILLSRAQGVRDDVETKEILTRTEKIGGAALPPERVDVLMNELHRRLATTQIVAEMPLDEQTEEPKNVKTQELDQPATVAKPPPPRPVAKPVAPAAPVVPAPIATKIRPSLSEALPAAQKFAGPDYNFPKAKPQKDDEEIATMRAIMADRIPMNDSATRTRAASVENIVRASGLTFPDPMLSERFKRVIEARFRDIRDTLETKQLLIKVVTEGGLGLALPEAEKTANLIEAEYQALTGLGTSEKKREAYQFETAKNLATVARDAMSNIREETAREERFYKIAKKSQKLQEAEVLLPVSTAPTTEHLVPSVVVPRKPVLQPVLSRASVSPSRVGKPLVEDVKVIRKIAGPIDELATMTVIEFRRLSKDPREATLKIRDKIELLKEEGFERYFAAVRAWQSSEPNRLYLALTHEALGKNSSVPTLINEKTQTSQSTLSLDEFHAILALNSQLQM